MNRGPKNSDDITQFDGTGNKIKIHTVEIWIREKKYYKICIPVRWKAFIWNRFFSTVGLWEWRRGVRTVPQHGQDQSLLLPERRKERQQAKLQVVKLAITLVRRWWSVGPLFITEHFEQSRFILFYNVTDPGSGAFFTPGSRMGKKSGSGILDEHPRSSETLETVFMVKNT
jgi:hypothetical protein